MAIQAITQPQTVATSVLRIREGDLVDLESCPYLNRHPSAAFQFATVDHVERETDECVVIWFEGIDAVGYPTGTVLHVVQPSQLPVQ